MIDTIKYNLKKNNIFINESEIPKDMLFYPIGEVYHFGVGIGNSTVEKSFYE